MHETPTEDHRKEKKNRNKPKKPPIFCSLSLGVRGAHHGGARFLAVGFPAGEFVPAEGARRSCCKSSAVRARPVQQLQVFLPDVCVDGRPRPGGRNGARRALVDSRTIHHPHPHWFHLLPMDLGMLGEGGQHGDLRGEGSSCQVWDMHRAECMEQHAEVGAGPADGLNASKSSRLELRGLVQQEQAAVEDSHVPLLLCLCLLHTTLWRQLGCLMLAGGPHGAVTAASDILEQPLLVQQE